MHKVLIKNKIAFHAHTTGIYALEAFENNQFFSAGGDGKVILWDISQPSIGKVIAKVPGSSYALRYFSNQQALYVGNNGFGVIKIDLNSRKQVANISLGFHRIFSIQIISERLWVGLDSGEIVILNTNLDIQKRIKYASKAIRHIHAQGDKIICTSSDHAIIKIDPNTLQKLDVLKGHNNSVFCAKYHPSGKYLISGGRDATLKVWDVLNNNICRESIPAHLQTINHLTFTADGRYFATGSMDKNIKIWDAHSFQLLKVIDRQRYLGHASSVNRVLWTKYDDLLISCGDDNKIIVWEIKVEATH